jgi:predicted nuclease of predicted toxin-antitoxin system
MPKRFHKPKLLLDENMSERQSFPHLNALFDVKHIRDDLNSGGLADPEVDALAAKLRRVLVTYHIKDFKALASQSLTTGVIGISPNVPLHHIDTKLTALLMRKSAKALLGKFTTITGETKAA